MHGIINLTSLTDSHNRNDGSNFEDKLHNNSLKSQVIVEVEKNGEVQRLKRGRYIL